MRAQRQGVILVIVAGMAAMIAAIAVSFIAMMRRDAETASIVVNDIQARSMLIAAQMYVSECSRLGWGSDETCGWNDLRNHAIGPIPITADPTATGSAVWTAGRWPAPGSVARCPMQVWTRPPAAVRPGSRNPLVVAASLADLNGSNGLYDDAGGIGISNLHGTTSTVTNVADLWQAADFSHPDPQAVTTNVADYLAGDPTPLTGTARLGWFRVYRETAADHDGNGTPYYDVINLNGGARSDGTAYPENGSVFVVTCGSGASGGFRTWAEVTAASANDEFMNDQGYFDQVRASETILWYRIEWWASAGDRTRKSKRQSSRDDPMTPGEWFPTSPNSGDVIPYSAGADYTGSTIMDRPSPFGSIRWVQRLDQEPPTW